MAPHDENLGVEKSPMERSYAVVLEPKTKGGYSVCIPALPEAHTQGETIEECLANAREVLALVLECRIDRGEDIPPSEFSGDSDSPWIAFEDRITSFSTSMVGKRSYPYTPSRCRNPACYMAFTRRRIVAERSANISEHRKKKGATKALFFFLRDRCYRLRASS